MARSTRSLVLGTAGHIDHGKTSLVHALTGVDTDRLPEEKRRGITIELGFAAWELGGGLSASIVDVPGHEAFVRTMVAGAGGIDLLLLVVSAEEGVMPQTREHLHVCHLLGLRHGVVALTKVDRLGGDEEAVQLAEADVRASLGELAPGLAHMPIVACSAHTGAGLPALTAAIRKVAAALPARPTRDRPIVPVDRVFALKGHGTVATGTLLTGRLDLARDARFQLIPAGPLRQPRELRARALHVRGAASEQASAGSRVALNLGNVGTDDLTRGDIITSGPRVARGQVCLALLTHLAHDGAPWRSGATVQLCAGTAYTTARIDPLGPLEDPPEAQGNDLAAVSGEIVDPVSVRTTDPRSARSASAARNLSREPAATKLSREPANLSREPVAANLSREPANLSREPASTKSPREPAASPDLSRAPASARPPREPTSSPDLSRAPSSASPPREPTSSPDLSRAPSSASPPREPAASRTARDRAPETASPDLSPETAPPARAPRPLVPPGATAIVRLRLDAPLPLWHGQRLIVRSDRSDLATRRHGHTTGGGLVLDPTPSAGRGQRGRWRTLARALARPDPAARVRALLRDAGALGTDRDDLERRAGLVELEPVLSDMRSNGDLISLGEHRFADAAVLVPLAAAAAAAVARFQAAHPLQPGLGRAAVVGGLPGRVAPDVAAAAVAHAVARGLLRADGELLTCPSETPGDPGLPPKVQAVLDLFRAAGIAPPTLREVQGRSGLGERQALEALGALQRSGALVRVSPELSLAREHHEALVARAREHLRSHGQIDVQALKTLTGLSRKFVVPFLEHLDRLQISRRQGDLRVPGPRL